MSVGELPIESLEAGLHEGDEQELDDDLSVLRGETGADVETEIAREEDARDTRIDLLEGLREMQGADAVRWRLYRVNDDDPKRNGFMDEIATGQLTQKWIRDSFGGGTYRIRGYHVASGKFKAGRTIRIASDAPKKGNESVTGSTNGAFNLQEYLAQQDARDVQRRREEEERRERAREEEDRKEERRRRNFLEMITAIGAIASPIVAQLVGKKDDTAALIAALKPKETSPLEMLQLMREMRELDRPSAEAPDAFERAFGFLERVKDMLPGAAGGGELSWLDVARTAIQTLGPGIGQGVQSLLEQAAIAKGIEAQRAGQAPPGMVAAPASLPRLAPPQGSPVSTQPPGAPGSSPVGSRPVMASPAGIVASPSTSPTISAQGDEEMLKLLPLLPWLKGETERLLVAAARGSDPELRAAAMFDDMPDNADIEAVGQVLSRPDWFQLFGMMDARVAQYEPWFAQVRGTLLELIAEETGVSFGARSDGGVTESGRQVVNVQGPGASAPPVPLPAGAHVESPAPARPKRDPNAPIERPAAPPSLTGE